jgi:2-polyprenyl-3-methyl-5-hydroxy-6-metoxy-1,4-benzoquinol methylase
MTVNKKIIKKLNQLNHDFYQKTAADFSDSRNYYWQGWEEILEFFNGGEVLDIACGNARFALFLNEKSDNNFNYLGLDNSENLLKLAKNSIEKKGVTAELKNFDLVDNFLKNSEINYPTNKRFKLIVSFGLTHHLASKKLRQEFLKSIEKIMENDGVAMISNWQFAEDKDRFEKNSLNLKKINTNSKTNIFQKNKLKNLLTKLEENDFLLDWRRGTAKDKAFRYCHFLDEKEMKELVEETSLKIVKSFFADGKSGKLNQYFILKKTLKK